MSALQYLRIVWARKWLALVVMILVIAGGAGYTWWVPKQYVATTSLVVEVRVDPVLGAVAPGLASPAYMATQSEILQSDRVAMRVVKMLGVERSPAAVKQWRDSTEAKIPLDRYFAELLQRGLVVEPSRGSNIINISFASQDAAFAASAANAFAQAYTDVSVELKIEPARQSAGFMDDQVRVLRSNLETAQNKLSKYQQDNGIVVSDERMDQETSRLNALAAAVAQAQSERVDAMTRSRNSGSDLSPDVQSNGAVQSLNSQLATLQSRLSEISQTVGPNHPQRIQLEAQIATVNRQISAEVRRVTGGSAVLSRGSSQKVAELQQLVDAQKKLVLSLRSQHDQVAILARDVETAQKAYEGVSQRVGMLNLEGQNTQANVRVLSQAVEPLYPAKPNVMKNIMAAIMGGIALGALAAIGFEVIDRRVRNPDDMIAMAAVPVIGVLRPGTSKQPIFRRLNSGMLAGPRPLLTSSGGQQ